MFYSPWFWWILGALLVLSEFFLTGIVAIFFGAGAMLVGVLVWLGVVESTALSIVLWAVLSLALLLVARERIRVWFRGRVSDRWTEDTDLIAARGSRAEVVAPFRNGVGKVRFSGTDWKAECDEDVRLQPGDPVWVTGHQGITLKVSTRPPASSTPPA
ncbi:MAG: hypothetical protein Kow0020_02780 [Wenzhouxiangellaceae bacterium]